MTSQHTLFGSASVFWSKQELNYQLDSEKLD